MKNKFKWVIIAVILVGVIAGATFLYNKYSKDLVVETPVYTTQKNNQQDTAALLAELEALKAEKAKAAEEQQQ